MFSFVVISTCSCINCGQSQIFLFLGQAKDTLTDNNMGKSAIKIALIAVGYAIAMTLLIISASTGDLNNLYLLFPLLLTPAFTLLIRPNRPDNDFWTLMAIFLISFSITSCIAMPFTMFSLDALGGAGLGYGLGAVVIILACGGTAGFIQAKEEDVFD